MSWRDKWTVVPAVYVLVRQGSEILLLRRYKTGYMDGYYSLPSGHFEGGESALTAAVREAKEEIGITVDPKQLKLVHVVHRLTKEANHERLDLFFDLSTWQGKVTNQEPHKCDELRWATIDELPDNMTPEVAKALSGIRANETYSDLGF